MFPCVICGRQYDFAKDLRNHVIRHTKLEIISFALPLELEITPEKKESKVKRKNHKVENGQDNNNKDNSQKVEDTTPEIKVEVSDAEEQVSSIESEVLKEESPAAAIKVKEELIEETDEAPNDLEKQQENHVDVQEINNNSEPPNDSDKQQENQVEGEEINNNSVIAKPLSLRRSSRLKESTACYNIMSKDKTYDENNGHYYFPEKIKVEDKNIQAAAGMDSGENKISYKRKRNNSYRNIMNRKSRLCLEPILKTPKFEGDLKHNSSDTDSWSGNGSSCPVFNKRWYCKFCGNGYKSEEYLKSHMQMHFNYCDLCDINFHCPRLFNEHVEKHLFKLFVCHFCHAEFKVKNHLIIHLNRHLDQGIIHDVLAMEKEIYNERNKMNTLYNCFNAGFQYGKDCGGLENFPTDFYSYFLQCTSMLNDQE